MNIESSEFLLNPAYFMLPAWEINYQTLGRTEIKYQSQIYQRVHPNERTFLYTIPIF